jgi:nucleoside-diphosphate-sugar epimerase
MTARHLVVFGVGYSGTAILREAAASGLRATGVSRSPTGDAVAFYDAGRLIAAATHLIATAPPGEDGDPVLARYSAEIAASPSLRWLGYMSTTGVYGDRRGAWVDEATEPAPGSDRARRRVAAEAAWRAAGEGRAVDLFRLAGIYGPGRSAVDDLLGGRTRSIRKPGHAFGRIHRDDIAGAVLAAVGQDLSPGVRVLNLSDDEPAEQVDVLAAAARLLGRPPPSAVPFTEAAPGMSGMARSFWAENRKVSSRVTQDALGYRWRYPTYREGLEAVVKQRQQDGA